MVASTITGSKVSNRSSSKNPLNEGFSKAGTIGVGSGVLTGVSKRRNVCPLPTPTRLATKTVIKKVRPRRSSSVSGLASVKLTVFNVFTITNNDRSPKLGLKRYINISQPNLLSLTSFQGKCHAAIIGACFQNDRFNCETR